MRTARPAKALRPSDLLMFVALAATILGGLLTL